MRVKVRRKGRNQRVRFEFPKLENDWPRGGNTGDGTVPLAGARPKCMDAGRLVCVSPRDFSAWEFQDRALARLAGFHGALPTVNLVQRITLRFLRRDYKGRVWARRPPGLSRSQWRKPSWLPEAD